MSNVVRVLCLLTISLISSVNYVLAVRATRMTTHKEITSKKSPHFFFNDILLINFKNFVTAECTQLSFDKTKKNKPLAGADRFLYLTKSQRCYLWPTPAAVKQTVPKEFIFNVRVLLEERPLIDPVPWIVYSEKGIVIRDMVHQYKPITLHSPMVQFLYYDNAWHVDGKPLASQYLSVEPLGEGHLRFDGKSYADTLLLMVDQQAKKRLLVSQIDIEDYVASVLRSESWPGWPLEVNKAFAIASRSYLAAKILESTARKQLYHIKNSNIHQTYNGVHTSELLKRATQETRGMILTYKNKPIVAMFDGCCGGVVPAHMAGVNFAGAPYLARKRACTFCKGCKIYSWRAEYPLASIEEILHNAGKSLPRIVQVKVTCRDKAGLVRQIQFKGKRSAVTLTGKECYSLFSKIKSYCFTVEKLENSIVFTGRGYGHHLGICQWGVRSMVEHGWLYPKILDFYYPGTKIMTLRSQH